MLQQIYFELSSSTPLRIHLWKVVIDSGLGLTRGPLVEAFLSRSTPLGLTSSIRLHNIFCTHVSDHCCSSLAAQCAKSQASRHICHTTLYLLIEYIASWHQTGPRPVEIRNRGHSQVVGRAEVSGIDPKLCTTHSPNTVQRDTSKYVRLPDVRFVRHTY